MLLNGWSELIRRADGNKDQEKRCVRFMSSMIRYLMIGSWHVRMRMRPEGHDAARMYPVLSLAVPSLRYDTSGEGGLEANGHLESSFRVRSSVS